MSDFGSGDLPRIAQEQPLVSNFHLPAVLDGLVEDAELVADAVTDGRHFQRGERVQVARREPAQTAVAEPRIFLLFHQVVEVDAEFLHRLAGILREAQVEELIGQMRPGQELRGKVGHHARVLLGVGLHGPYPLLEYAVPNGQSQRGVGVVTCCGHGHAPKAAEQVIEE